MATVSIPLSGLLSAVLLSLVGNIAFQYKIAKKTEVNRAMLEWLIEQSEMSNPEGLTNGD